jgi:signal transduction histidine kinase
MLRLPDAAPVVGQRPGEVVGCAHAHDGHGGCGTAEFCRTCGALHAALTGLNGMEAVEECRIALANGEMLDLEVHARPLYLNDKRYAVVTLRDISARQRRRALERVFFHDVLNTAGIVSTYTDMLEHHPDDLPRVLDDLTHAAHRLVDEIRAQKTLLAAETGDLRLNMQVIDVHPFLSEMVQQYEFHPLAERRCLRLHHPQTSVVMHTDGTLLGRVIGNMLKNALEATHPGGAVTLTCDASSHHVTFSVQNPAVMNREVQLQVFNRSYSTKGIGRGLGTYSMKMLSERYLRGSVWFESTPERGTTFYARYPISIDD